MPVDTSTTPNTPVPERAARTLWRTQLLFGAVLIAGLAFLAGVWFASATDSPHNNDTFDLFWQSWDILDREFYYGLPEDRELVYGAIRGLMTAVGDRYTFFAPPTQAEFDRQTMAGSFGGIGAYVSQDTDGNLIIVAPFAGYPAEQAGLMADDIILEVDGTPIKGWAFDDAVSLLRGDVGTSVTVRVLRPSTAEEFTVEIVRARVEMPTVIADRYGDIGYVRLFSFNDRATELLDQEIAKLMGQGISALILDLRGNPGGLLDQAVSVSDLFLEEGLVVYQEDRSGRRTDYYADAGQIAESIPLAVLIDEGSASASEVVAGALQDHRRAILVGETSFGKGSVQHVYDLADGSQVHVTVALWFTPSDRPIQGNGLEPDVVVQSDSSEETDTDPFIEAAIRYLESLDE